MSSRLGATMLLLLLLILAPLAALCFGTIYYLRIEPLLDYIAGYVLLLVGFASAAFLMLGYLLWRGAPDRSPSDMIAYILLGALGSAAFWGWFSAEPKIGQSGIDPGSVVLGAVLGALFGAAFCWLSGRRSQRL